MKVIFTCGGTAGHVNPALALAGYMREKDAGTQILFVGAERGLERDLIAHTDYPFRTVNISSFHRSFRLDLRKPKRAVEHFIVPPLG